MQGLESTWLGPGINLVPDVWGPPGVLCHLGPEVVLGPWCTRRPYVRGGGEEGRGILVPMGPIHPHGPCRLPGESG